jgi:hypothetical protein
MREDEFLLQRRVVRLERLDHLPAVEQLVGDGFRGEERAQLQQAHGGG